MKRCRSGAADHIAAANAAVSFAPALRLRAVAVGRNFPEMCVMKPTFAVCGSGGTAGFVAIRGRGAEDNQAMQ